MIFLTLSILCSVTVGVMLKLAKRYQIDVRQAITWNYAFAIVLCLFFFKPAVAQISLSDNFPLYLSLGILLPTIFFFLGKSVKRAGLARTDIAQRLSLFISLSAAYFIFNENFDWYKEVGVVFGFAAIIFIMYRKTVTASKNAWLYLLLVFMGYGVIDILFKKVSQIIAIPYTTSLAIIFCIAFVISLIYVVFLAVIKKIKLQLINFICGCVLGMFNFGNIFCYLKAHQAMADNPSAVFAAMNLGVIIAGSLVGVLVFKERLTKSNYLGLCFAIAAIVLITLSKFYTV